MSKKHRIVNCPKCKKIYKNQKDTMIECACNCLFTVDENGKLEKIINYNHIY